MIDKNKIEEAAYDFEDGELIEDKLKRAAFKAGIVWFKENLWHDVNEEPKDNRFLLVEMSSIFHSESLEYKVTQRNIYSLSWNTTVKTLKFTRWLYIDDLIEDKNKLAE